MLNQNEKELLYRINSNADLRAVPERDIPELCRDIREFLVENVSHTGGHLASNLGSVELTVALHRVYDPMKDRILFDVGHQSYVHKILTGRRDSFDTLRQLDGISGFPKPCESTPIRFLPDTPPIPCRWPREWHEPERSCTEITTLSPLWATAR